MKILIVGGAGLVGSQLANHLENIADILSVDKQTFDITDYNQCLDLISENRPDVIINTAAFLNADKCEDDFVESYRVNALGVGNLCKAIKSVSSESLFIHFSSDFVFDGDAGYYTEEDVPNPINIYGVHKWIADEIIKNNEIKNYYIFRIASVIGYHPERNNFLKTILSLLAKGKNVSVVKDIKISMTTTELIANITEQFIKNKQQSGLYNCVASGETTWFDIAKFSINHLNLGYNLLSTSREEYVTKAKRPANSVLSNSKIMNVINDIPNWDDVLKEHLDTNKDLYLTISRGMQ